MQLDEQKRNKEKLIELQGITNIKIMGVPEWEIREKSKKIFKEIMVENFQNGMKTKQRNLDFGEAQHTK